MKVLDALAARPPGLQAAAVTIGKFFAVHRGHQALIRATCEAARRRGVASVVLTFDRHPQEVLRPGTTFPLLATLEERLELIGQLGPDYAVVARLDREFLGQTPEEFVRAVLVERLGVVELLASDNFRFGRGAVGTVETLKQLGEQEGFAVTVVPPVLVNGEPISSSRVADCLREGNVESAAALLGRPYHLCGPVIRGEQIGRQLGFPTANVAADPQRLLPGDGVYAATAAWEGQRVPAAVNVGLRPTVQGAQRTVEAHLLDFDGDLYGRNLCLEFRRRIRGEQKFAGLEALKEQIAKDVQSVREGS